jgi:hypothetical protein
LPTLHFFLAQERSAIFSPVALAGPIFMIDQECRKSIDDNKSAWKANTDYSNGIQREKAATENIE